MEHFKYPKTPHLPWSEGLQEDDVFINSLDKFKGEEIVVTEKMDGECTSMYSDYIHARSLDSRHHASRSYVKLVHARVSHQILGNYSLSGENCYAEHSIHYSALPDWFLAFGYFYQNGPQLWSLSWDYVEEMAKQLDLITVPVLYRGTFDEEKVRNCITGISRCGGEQEGYVVRVTRAFQVQEFASVMAKYVRAGHVQTDEHWMNKPIIVNGLTECPKEDS